MRVLIIEDDPFKLRAIEAFLRRLGAEEIEVATSLRASMVKLEGSVFDFVVLDMAIPSHTSDVGAVDTYSQPVGGLDVLLFLVSGSRPERVAILTQHPTIEYNRRHVPLRDMAGALRSDNIDSVLDVIHFTESGDWERRLSTLLADFK